jgi:uncharacterized protein (TIGR04255 family)
MNWEPAHADHAIDRAVATLTMLSPVDLDTFDELLVIGRKAAASHGLTRRLDQQEPIDVPAGGQAIFVPDNYVLQRRVVFQRIDPTTNSILEEFAIGMGRMAFATTQYRGWAHFFHLIKDMCGSLERVIKPTGDIKTVRLEYFDRFQSAAGGADHFEVVMQSSGYLPAVLRDKAAALHAHTGWFDYEVHDVRRLTNVNIDVNDLKSMPKGEQRRSVTMLTLGQLEALSGSLIDPMAQLDALHGYLKDIFRAIITAEVATRIRLND